MLCYFNQKRKNKKARKEQKPDTQKRSAPIPTASAGQQTAEPTEIFELPIILPSLQSDGFLANLNYLKIKQIPTPPPVFTRVKGVYKSEYKIFDHMETVIATGEGYRPLRPIPCFENVDDPTYFQVFDCDHRQILEITRAYRLNVCSCFGSPCHPETITIQKVEGTSPADRTTTGYILQQKSKRKFGLWIIDSFLLCNSDGEVSLTMEQSGSMGIFESCTRPKTPYHEFPLFRQIGNKKVKVGNIRKLFGLGNLTGIKNCDVFEIYFPVDIDVSIKATCIAAVFLINQLYFCGLPNHGNHTPDCTQRTE